MDDAQYCHGSSSTVDRLISNYGKYCPLPCYWWSDPDLDRRRNLSSRQIRHSAGAIARGYPHRRGEWQFLFSDHKLDFGFSHIDDCDELDRSILGKVRFNSHIPDIKDSLLTW
jgi:hypothetical protein